MIRLSSLLAILGLCCTVPAAPALGYTWNVNTYSGICSAISSANTGDEIVVAPGRYHHTNYVEFYRPGVTIRGATGNPDDVVLYGDGMNADSGQREGLCVATDNITIRDLTISDMYWNGIHIRAENDADGTIIRNVKTINIGERHIKGSRNASRPDLTSDNVLIEGVQMIQTQAARGNYVGGIDAMGITNWTIRNSRAEGIHGTGGDARGAIFLWFTNRNPVIENNVFIDCDRAICIGNGYHPEAVWNAEGGIIANNMILKGDEWGIELGYTKDLKVYNNTVVSPTGTGSAVYVYGGGTNPTVNLHLANNLLRGGFGYSEQPGAIELDNNLVGDLLTIPDAWFVDAAAGDYHLLPGAGAIDQGVWLAQVPTDIDGEFRDAFPDIGADEIPEPATISLLALGLVALLRRRPQGGTSPGAPGFATPACRQA